VHANRAADKAEIDVPIFEIYDIDSLNRELESKETKT
jgi:hypothetical protein